MEYTVTAQHTESAERISRTVYGDSINAVIWAVWAELGRAGYRLISVCRPIVLPSKAECE